MGAQGIEGQGSNGQCSAREAGHPESGEEERGAWFARYCYHWCSLCMTTLPLVSPLFSHVRELRTVHPGSISAEEGKGQAALDRRGAGETGPHGLCGTMAPVFWEETSAGDVQGGWALWYLMLGGFFHPHTGLNLAIAGGKQTFV